MSISAISMHAPPVAEKLSLGPTSEAAGGKEAFGQLLQDALGGAAQANLQAEQAIQALASGQVDGLHHLSLAVARADLNFRFILEVRNRLTEAYQEVMRMQI
jgi:flagellar hook-basal body complex protein FliE